MKIFTAIASVTESLAVASIAATSVDIPVAMDNLDIHNVASQDTQKSVESEVVESDRKSFNVKISAQINVYL